MKPYSERLPLIDAAVEYFSGEWPVMGNKNLVLAIHSGIYVECLDSRCELIDYELVCNEQEFNKRSKELGYINGYKYGVEYETNGEKPDLPDDVLVEVKANNHFYRNEWCESKRQVCHSRWSEQCIAFRIVDERYKPKEQNMSDWYEKGELPPIGEVVEFCFTNLSYADDIVENWKNGDQLEVLAHRVGGSGEPVAVVWNKRDKYAICLVSQAMRPLRTETDKLVEQAKEDFVNAGVGSYTTYERKCIEALTEAGYRKIKLISRDEVISKIFGLTDGVSMVDAAMLYDAGLRLLAQGE